ncbi:MAG TPA: hypothetical protein VH374_23650 [Polyangia bacterium]|nr:hypothetical protein [Polyangia bacterium]
MTTVDESGRTSTRVFAEARTAASLIESWTLDEDPMLLVPAPDAQTARAGALPLSLPGLQSAARVHLHGGPETSLAADRSVWLGVTLGACVRAGAICAGARLRSMRDADLTGASQPDTVLREDVDLLATAAWLHDAGGFLIVPAVGVGAGWFRTRTEGGLLRDASVLNDHGLRLEVSLQGRWPLGPHTALAAELGGAWSPFARSQATDDQGAILIGEPAGHVRLGLFCVVTP